MYFILVKLDMIKAYDKVNWHFLHLVLLKFGFHPNGVNGFWHVPKVPYSLSSSMEHLLVYLIELKVLIKETPCPLLSSSQWSRHSIDPSLILKVRGCGKVFGFYTLL